MQQTLHIDKRMNQRGIKGDLVALAIQLGEAEGDKYILSRNIIREQIAELDQQRKLLLDAEKKGGVVVVSSEDTAITTYRHDSFKRAKRKNNQ